MSESIEHLLVKLRSADAAHRREAAEQFATSPDSAIDACLELVDAITDPDEEVRNWVTEALEGMGPPSVAQVPALVERLANRDAERSYWSATLLGRLGADAAQATSALASALNEHASLATRERAAWALGKIGPGARSAIDALRIAVQSDSPRLSKLAASALDTIGAK